MEAGRTPSARAAPTVALILGLAVIAAYVSVALVLIDRTSFDVWGAVLLAPILVGVSVPALRRQAFREADSRTFRLLLLALIVKLAGAVARYYVAFSVYGGVADATGYNRAGVELADSFRHLDFSAFHLVTGTGFIENLTGLVYALIGPSKLGGFVFFSWLGFWGLFLFYRAFTIAVPLGRRLSYAHLLFFLPSHVFWPSSIGKEAWMMFGLGIAAYGVAKILTYAAWRGVLPCVAGLWMAGMVRPPVAALVAVSLAAAVVTRKSKVDLREMGPVVKGGLIIVVVVSAAVLLGRSDRFLQDAGIDTSGGINSTLTGVQSRTSEGGSAFVPSIVTRPARAPIAAITVLFRPFVFEAHNFQSFLSAIEGTALLLLCLARFRWGLTALRSLRRQPFVVFCLVFSVLFIVGYSSYANFGLLARQRVQVYPLFLVLFSIPPATLKTSVSARLSRSRSEAVGV